MQANKTAAAELIPGTEILYDLHGGQSQDEETRILIPRPSSNEDDPLNWTPTWKAVVITNQAIFVFISVLTPLSIAPLTGIFIHEFHKTLPEVNMLFGAAAMALGYANLLIVPFSNVFGRRPTIIICGLICVAANIWQAEVKTYRSFIGARVISGLGAAANESIMPIVIADVMFLHQRGLWMGLYFWSYFLGLFIGPIISGSVAAVTSWRWFFWICTILQAVNLVIIILTFPETKYRRPEPLAISRSGSGGVMASSSSSEENKHPTSDDETVNPAPKIAPTTTTTDIEYRAFTSVRGRPSRGQFSLLLKPDFQSGNIVIRDVLAPIQIFAFPIISWASFSLGFAANCLLALNLTQAQVFAAPPYNFSSAQVGFVNFAFVVGGIIGLLTAGPFSDYVSKKAAIRNNGVREAEMRLVALIPYIAILIVGMTVTAVGYDKQWHWEPIVIVGYTCVGIEVVSIPAIVISYAVDCYKHLPGQIMVSATIVKNTFGFGMIFFFNDWAVRSGFKPPVLTLMALAVGFSAVGCGVFLKWGKTFRRMTANSKLHQL